MNLPDVALFRWNRVLADDQGADLGFAYGPWCRGQRRPAVTRRLPEPPPPPNPSAEGER